MTAALRELVRQRAIGRCEYCRMPQAAMPDAPFHVEHVVARQHRGTEDPANLALACPQCNCCKGTNLAGIDPDSAREARLFHPRSDLWDEHFTFDGERIHGLTAVGRTTAWLLRMNSGPYVMLRRQLMDEGVW